MTDVQPDSGDLRSPQRLPAPQPDSGDLPAPRRGRQIVLVFLLIGVITGAFTALHALLPGNPLDKLVGITPIVLVGLIAATVWLLYRQARRG